jgi:acetolactate synthase-1/2/3 large subunit
MLLKTIVGCDLKTGDEMITGADVLTNFLHLKNVSKIFAITGAGNLAIIDSIVKKNKVEIIYFHHEQAAAMAAQGYAKISGKPGVVVVTTGGGTSNVVTGILSAYLDSVPLIIISGNESSFHCNNQNQLRAYGVQGFDSVEVIKPIAKRSLRINEVNEIEFRLQESWNLMLDKRMGPVHIDFPMDLQRNTLEVKNNSNSLNTENPKKENVSLENGILYEEIIRSIQNSKNPILYLGNGCRNPEVIRSLIKIIESLKIPFALSWSALDIIPCAHEFNIGRIGIYGDRAANILLQRSDLVLCIGTRLAIPQVGFDKNDFGRNASKIVIDVDVTELSKFNFDKWYVFESSAKDFTDKLALDLKNSAQIFNHDSWIRMCKVIKESLPRIDQIGYNQIDQQNYLHSYDVINFLNFNLESKCNVVTDVGAGLLTGHYGLELTANQRLITSQGLGEMGFGLPGAIGAYFAEPDAQLICLNTDGGIMFNLQELQLLKHHKIPIKLFIFNNSGYSMIKISQQNLFQSRLAGSSPESGISFPNFELLAKTFEMTYIKLNYKKDLNKSLKSELNSTGPTLIEVIMDPSQRYLPRLSTSKGLSGSLVSPPIEDLDPLIEIDVLEKLLGYRPLKQSFEIRGLKYE